MRPFLLAAMAAATLIQAPMATTALAASAAAAPAPAELPEPTGRVLLTVTGAISKTNSGDAAVFDLAMLDALASRDTTTETPWFDESRTFSGPLASALLDAVGAKGDTVLVTAINNYAAEIPIEDFRSYPVILATRIDGTVLSVRDKGPIFVIYPFDLDPDLYNEVMIGRSVWQVTAIEVF